MSQPYTALTPAGLAAREAFFERLKIDPATRARLKSEHYDAAWSRAAAAAIDYATPPEVIL